MKDQNANLRTALLTGLSLIAFAANSLLTRMALGEASIDAASFVTIRLTSGALMLLFISAFSQTALSQTAFKKTAFKKTAFKKPSFSQKSFSTVPHSHKPKAYIAAVMLFVYAVAFSFAYRQLAAGTGALILFGTVQLTMVLAALKQGEKPSRLEWSGLFIAMVGLVYLVSPGLAAPPIVGSMLMMISGIAWGFYSLIGRGAISPVVNTQNNFIRAVPLALGVSLISFSQWHLSAQGIVLAVLSGALASGVGYALWYAALRGLTATRAATVQLSVPVIAAAGGTLFLNEALSVRLAIASLMILGGIGTAVLGRRQKSLL
ncbi:MAG: DMT family transporter [Cyanobacteria bacterium J06649_5]